MTTVAFNITTVELGQSTLHLLNGSISYTYNFTPNQQLSQPSSEQPQYAGLLYTPSVDRRCLDVGSAVISNLTLTDLTQGYVWIPIYNTDK